MPPSVSRPPHLLSGLLLASAGAIAFSGKAIVVKLAYRYNVDAVTVIMYRMLFALPLFLLLLWWTSRPVNGQKPEPLRRRDWLGVLGLGVTGYYLASFLDFWGLEYISASLERLILYLNPTIVLVLGWLLFKRPIAGIQIVAMAVSYAGVLLVFGHEVGAQGPHASFGAALVFGSAISYALYLIYSGEMVKRLGSLRLVSLATTVACVLCLLQFVLLRPLSAADVAPEVLWLSLLNATACTVAPVVMVMMAIERIGPGLTAQTGMIGPMSTILMGAFILGEPLNPSILAGTALVMAGVFLVTRLGRAPAK
ncbi:DMT family transporter [Hydrogenophaga sp.]|uniref:DMT family transporter n=1 Tax=Hydrogenophaga sp. TaxID=1904254 RepID=UPI0035B3D579